MVRLSLLRRAAQAGAFNFRQEMPPPNGYPPIPVDRMRTYRFYGNYAFFTAVYLITAIMTIKLTYTRDRRDLSWIEVHNSLVPLEPFIEAERDRLYMKHLHQLRDEEIETAKRWKDWIPGTIFGVPLFYTIHEDEPIRTYMADYQMFRPRREASRLLWPTQTSNSGS